MTPLALGINPGFAALGLAGVELAGGGERVVSREVLQMEEDDTVAGFPAQDEQLQ